MKIKLSALKLPKTTGTFYSAQNRANSASNYDSNGITISELYWQQKTGVLGGVELGVITTLWVSHAQLQDTAIYRGDRFVIDGKNYEIVDYKEEILSAFENHYEIDVREVNL